MKKFAIGDILDGYFQSDLAKSLYNTGGR